MSKTIRTLAGAALAATVLAFPPGQAKAGPDPFLGELMLFGGNFCPRGWAKADGQLMAISQFSALFSLYGTIYGGDGRTTFALPDLRGRAPINAGQGPGLQDYREGARVGVETVTLNVVQMPSHSHAVTSTAQLQASDGPVNAASAADGALANQAAPHYSTRGNLDETMEAGSVTVTSTALNTGGNQAHETRGPRLAMFWCVATVGVFPSRS
ncbi:MAG: phage tail protein [Rhodobacteraceae bacterium]|nr:MAG: phage tail protein [Paracoccaceae bacterium]